VPHGEMMAKNGSISRTKRKNRFEGAAWQTDGWTDAQTDRVNDKK